MKTIRILIAAALLSAQVQATETILSPRSKAEHEADLKALQEKYGPARDDARALTVDSRPSPVPPTSVPAPSRSTPTSVAPPPVAAQRVRITLYPDGDRGFLYNEKRYDTTALTQLLGDLGRQQRLDSLLLLERDERLVELTHVVELAKLGKALKLPTMYQQGSEFKSISAQ